MTMLVVFGEDWGRHPSSTQHLISILRNDYDVLWVNSIGLRRPKFRLADFIRVVQKIAYSMGKQGLSKACTVRGEDKQSDHRNRFTIVQPLVLPFFSVGICRLLNGLLLQHRLRKYLPSEQKVVLWLSLPSAVDVVGKLGESHVVYYCGDDFSALAGVDHNPISSMEQELLAKADTVLVASEALRKKFAPRYSVVIPHGVDVSLFKPGLRLPEDLPKGKPIAGFYGALADWIDVELLTKVARDCQSWNFVLIGPVSTDIAPLAALDNVTILGAKRHQDLPAYVSGWQVSLLPFRSCPQIKACNPLKLREYLAVGKPVIATDFPALDGYRDCVNIVDSAESFVTALREINAREYAPDCAPQHRKNVMTRRTRVLSESWLMRAHEVQRLLPESRLGPDPVETGSMGLSDQA
ncbi:MAG: glycosyltransferase [Pseudomonadales bacterium]|uniref:Glycosyltransferase n=1 Tax=Oleiphilus messinensis TaxID=141451 RepID=A0A1Y0I603_9GAMM|nr:glycosyltransferase [Oleiphilus messinensis]ARU55226.1 glycosyltransferase [Oleiphilus messinensis]MCG8611148.1 glycosyltransferase [Pseudomonadales bacterium]